MKRLLLGLLLLGLALPLVRGEGEDDFLRPVGKPPKATPQRRQGGEAMPPLPLPATPLRRSEKKRPPSPATLVGKVIWGSYKDWQWDDGELTRVFDWNMVPADCQQLLQAARNSMGLDYKVETLSLEGFNASPAEIPVLFFSGGRSLNFGEAQRETLRRYMLAGGMVVFDSVVGSPYFYKSALAELGRIMPESQLTRVPLDYPLFHMVDDSLKLSVQTQRDIPPVLEGLYVGNRLAAVVSPYGLGCGWDRATPVLIPKANYYDANSATLLGLNLMAYALGYFRVGQAHAKASVYRQEDLVPNAAPLVFAQVRTNGVWNTEPGAPDNLLRFLNGSLNVKTNYRVRTLDLGKDPLDGLTFLYLSGLGDFAFTDAELARLRRFLGDGGYLLVNNSLGLADFDRAARRELGRLAPGATLARLPAEHPVFTKGPFPMSSAAYTLAVQALQPKLNEPWLEGLSLDGEGRVFYSKYDLAAGWQGDDHPLALAYQTGPALQLGADLLTHFMTH